MTADSTPRRAEIFGVPVDAVGREAALARAEALFTGARPGRPALVFTPNPELIMHSRHDAGLLAVARAADLALPDGVGVVWALRRRGVPLAGRVPGVEFMGDLLARAAAEGRPVYFLGGRPDVIGQAAVRAAERFPGLCVAGTHDGYFGPEAAARVAAGIAASGAQLLFVGMGAPAQERFLAGQRAALGAVRLAMGVGGSFDVLAGVTRRAPPLVRRAGLEWLWRLAAQPRRWRRQLALPRFALAVLRAPRA